METRNREWGMGNEEWGMRNGEWGMGNYAEYNMKAKHKQTGVKITTHEQARA